MQRINLFPTTGFLNGISGSAEHTVANGEMTVKPGERNVFSAVIVHDVGRDELVLSVEVKGSWNVLVFDSDRHLLASTGESHNVSDWTVKTIRFTPSPGKGLIIGFYPVGGELIVRRPQLELASTFDSGVGGGYPRFFTAQNAPY